MAEQVDERTAISIAIGNFLGSGLGDLANDSYTEETNSLTNSSADDRNDQSHTSSSFFDRFCCPLNKCLRSKDLISHAVPNHPVDENQRTVFGKVKNLFCCFR